MAFKRLSSLLVISKFYPVFRTPLQLRTSFTSWSSVGWFFPLVSLRVIGVGITPVTSAERPHLWGSTAPPPIPQALPHSRCPVRSPRALPVPSPAGPWGAAGPGRRHPQVRGGAAIGPGAARRGRSKRRLSSSARPPWTARSALRGRPSSCGSTGGTPAAGRAAGARWVRGWRGSRSTAGEGAVGRGRGGSRLCLARGLSASRPAGRSRGVLETLDGVRWQSVSTGRSRGAGAGSGRVEQRVPFRFVPRRYKGQGILRASPRDVWECIKPVAGGLRTKWDQNVKDFEVIEAISDVSSLKTVPARLMQCWALRDREEESLKLYCVSGRISWMMLG